VEPAAATVGISFFTRAGAMSSRSEDSFFRFSAATLVLTSVAKLYSSAGSAKVFQMRDALLHVGYRPLMIAAGLVELAAAVFLFKTRSDLRRSLVLLWLSGNFLVYHWGSHLLGFQTCPCLGRLTDSLRLPPGSAEIALQVLVLFWLLNSLNILWRVWGSPHWARLFHRPSRMLQEASPGSSPG
jgi:hypothetical protein